MLWSNPLKHEWKKFEIPDGVKLLLNLVYHPQNNFESSSGVIFLSIYKTPMTSLKQYFTKTQKQQGH